MINSINPNQTVLVVDSETDFLQWVRQQLKASGVRVITETNQNNAFKIFCLEKPDLVIAEMKVRQAGGLDLLAKIRAESSNAMVIIISAFGTTQAVIESMKLGAFDFLRKESLPFTLKVVVETALKASAELRAASPVKPALTVEQFRDDIVGQSEAMQSVFKMVGRVAMSDAPVLVTGESGSGKELVARAIHHYSERSKKSLLAINCAAIPENLLESELFGHEKGSFTGAATQRIGRFEQCNGGTLFLDEIGEMPLAVQSKLLRVLQEGEFSRVGGNATIKANVRIVAATNRNLEQAIAAKEFREDLYYRLNVIQLEIPPLRERPDDIVSLAKGLLIFFGKNCHKTLLGFTDEAMSLLKSYPWPGNIRELRNIVERAVILCEGNRISVDHLPENMHTTYTAIRIGDPVPLDKIEEEHIRRVLASTRSLQEAADLLGIDQATLWRRRKQYGI